MGGSGYKGGSGVSVLSWPTRFGSVTVSTDFYKTDKVF